MHRNETDVNALAEDNKRRAEEILVRLTQTRQQAAETLEELNAQGEKLEKTQDNVDIIFEEQSFARRHLRSIASVFGSFANKFYATPEETLKEQQIQEQIEARKQAAKQAAKQTTASKPGLFSAEAAKPVTTVNPSQHQLRQTDHMLDQMFDQLSDLKAMNAEMQKESEGQNKRLDVLNETTAVANDDMRGLIREIRTVRNK